MDPRIVEHLEKGPASSKELQAITGLTQTAISRNLRALGNKVIRIGSGRSTQYALARNAFNSGDNFPIYAIDPHGNTIAIAHLRPLAHGGFFVESTNATPRILLGETGNGLFDDLPFFLEDLRPQGFLGRQLARKLAETAGYPADPRNWNSEQLGSYLIADGDDLPGNFKIGQQNFLRVPREFEVLPRSDYPTRADQILKGSIVGSSAGGEQPKFTAFTEEHDHVIVKFSPSGDNAVARRWRDILLTEYHAEQTLKKAAAHAFSAVEVQIHEIEDRLYLESMRFDRHGPIGRMPMISLLSIDAEFVGAGSNWVDVALGLLEQELITGEHLVDTIVLHTFGQYINNSDMHLGNLSLSFEGAILKLLPVYDMCSMGFAPKSGEVSPYSFSIKVSSEDRTDHLVECAAKLAVQFWDSLANDERISDELKAFLDKGNPVQL